ncbi:MAG TPA: GPW/gp25 family protein, partial [Bacteroidia bacterium]|nr:GPW/gp25 family protein [Bacteroidia bacterium]
MENPIIGKGWSFPPSFDNSTDTVVITTDDTDIQNSLHILLSTTKGERVMEPDYGCNLDKMLFEPITTGFKTYISEMVRHAILIYEARIDVNSITVDDSMQTQGLIRLIIDYVVRTTNSRYNYVFPYYLNEGT